MWLEMMVFGFLLTNTSGGEGMRKRGRCWRTSRRRKRAVAEGGAGGREGGGALAAYPRVDQAVEQRQRPYPHCTAAGHWRGRWWARGHWNWSTSATAGWPAARSFHASRWPIPAIGGGLSVESTDMQSKFSLRDGMRLAAHNPEQKTARDGE